MTIQTVCCHTLSPPTLTGDLIIVVFLSVWVLLWRCRRLVLCWIIQQRATAAHSDISVLQCSRRVTVHLWENVEKALWTRSAKAISSWSVPLPCQQRGIGHIFWCQTKPKTLVGVGDGEELNPGGCFPTNRRFWCPKRCLHGPESCSVSLTVGCWAANDI